MAASGTLAELLGQREVRLRLAAVDGRAEDRLQRAGSMTRSGDWFTVQLSSDDDGVTVPELVRDLVGLGVRVHAVEPVRISLEDRLLAVLRNEEPTPVPCTTCAAATDVIAATKAMVATNVFISFPRDQP